MKIAKIGVGLVLWLVVAGLGYYLYTIIQEPVLFKQSYEKNYTATTNRMYDIKTAQAYYLKANGKYAKNLDDLIHSVKNDIITEVVINGNPDDTSQVATYDTLRYTILEDISKKSSFKATKNVDSLKYIPFSGGTETFDYKSDVIKQQRVEVPVYEVSALKSKYLKGLKEEYLRDKEDLYLGSITEPTERANWE